MFSILFNTVILNSECIYSIPMLFDTRRHTNKEINFRHWKNEQNLKNRAFSTYNDSFILKMAIFYFGNSYFPFPFTIPDSNFSTRFNQSDDKESHLRHLIGCNVNCRAFPRIWKQFPKDNFLSHFNAQRFL